MARDFLRRGVAAAAAGLLYAGLLAQPARADNLPTLAVTVFQAPSYSVWLPTLIVDQKFDAKHGFHLKVTEKSGPTAYLDLARGVDQLCLCVAPQTFSQFVAQGADVTLLFSIFSFTNLVAAWNPRITSVKDLSGKTIATDTATGMWAVSSFLLKQSGLDLSKTRIISESGTAPVAELAAHRVDAILPGPVDVASLATQTSDFHTFSVYNAAAWQKAAPGPGVPNILLGVQRGWWNQPANKEMAQRFYAAIQDAAAFAKAHPQQTADIVGKHSRMPARAVLYALTHFPDIVTVRPASDYRSAVALITQKLMPQGGQLDGPLSDAQLSNYISDFKPR